MFVSGYEGTKGAMALSFLKKEYRNGMKNGSVLKAFEI